MTRTFAVEERLGRMPYMVTWQSPSGRIGVAYLPTYLAAAIHRDRLVALGLTAKLWAEVETDGLDAG